MELSREKITNILLVSLVVIAVSSILLGMKDEINQACILIEFGILITLAFINGIFNEKIFLAVFLINIASLMVTFLNHKGFGIYVIFLNLILMCMIFNNITVSKRTYVVLHLVAAVLLSVVVFGTNISHTVFYPANTKNPSCIFGGKQIESNMISAMCIGCGLHWLCLIDELKLRNASRLIIEISVGLLFGYRIYETKCRSVMFAAILFVTLYLLKRNAFRYKTYYILMIAMVIACGVFTIIYMEFQDVFDSFNSMDKGGTSRVNVWKEAFAQIKSFLWFGSGTDYKMFGFESAHNMVLHVLKVVGVIPIVTLGLFINKRVFKKEKPTMGFSYNRVAQFAFIGCMIIAFFEAYLLESYLYIVFLIFLVNFDNKADFSQHIGT